MNKQVNQRKAFAVIEYLVMVAIIVLTFITFRFYVQHGYQGQMARTGESFAFGRQYDPEDTIVCAYDGFWYSEACYNHQIGLGSTSAAAKLICRDQAGCNN